MAILAVVEGRYADAVRILDEGAARDLAAKNTDRAASEVRRRRAMRNCREAGTDAAVAAAEKALANSKAVKIRFLAARTFIEAGEIDRPGRSMTGLAAELQAEPQAHAKIIEGDIALKSGDARQAIKLLTEANTLLDTWIGHLRPRPRVPGGWTRSSQADSEFDRCIKRRGEALALFVDEDPSLRLFPVGLLLPGTRPRRTWQCGLDRII